MVSVRADQRPVLRIAILPNLIPAVAQQLVPMTVEMAADSRGLPSQRVIRATISCSTPTTTPPAAAARYVEIIYQATCQRPLVLQKEPMRTECTKPRKSVRLMLCAPCKCQESED